MPYVVRVVIVRMFAVLGMLAALITVSSGTAAACSCAMRTPAELVGDAEAVFMGTVVAVRTQEPVVGRDGVTAVLRADHVYKGAADAEFVVTTAKDSAACGYELVAGRRHLVFANVQDARLTTTLCSGNLRVPATGRPLRLGDQVEGLEKVTPELIEALGEPTRVEASKPASATPAPAGSASGRDRTGLVPAGGLVAAVLLVGAAAGLVWVKVRRRKAAR